MEDIVNQLRPGELVALFYRTKAEQFTFSIPYLKQGLARNQRCLYIADDVPIRMILERLQEAGVDVAAAQKRGALDVFTKSETYLRHGQFAPEKMILDLELDVQASLAKGFSALRGSGDMSWALNSQSMLDRMVEYQRKLSQAFPANFLAVCQYDETRFPKEILDEMELVHHAVIRNGELKRTKCDGAQPPT